MKMMGGNYGGACCLIVWDGISTSDSWSEFVLSSCWLGISASLADNVEGCALAQFVDLGTLLAGMIAKHQIFIEWLLIKLVAIWFKHYSSCTGNSVFKVAKLWVCYGHLGALTGWFAGHFQEIYVNSTYCSSYMWAWQENDLSLITLVKQVRM